MKIGEIKLVNPWAAKLREGYSKDAISCNHAKKRWCVDQMMSTHVAVQLTAAVGKYYGMIPFIRILKNIKICMI